MKPTSKRNVVVTGFGPFGDILVNSSWEAVKELSNIGLSIEDIDLVTKEIPVEYKFIDKKIPLLWKKYDPILMVHVGVSGSAQTLTLEQCAHRDGYTKVDIKGKMPKNHCCHAGTNDCLVSTLDMTVTADSEHMRITGVNAVVSNDPGRYLCDYIYYTSLAQNKNPAAFIHVPTLNKTLSKLEMATGIRAAILSFLDQISS